MSRSTEGDSIGICCGRFCCTDLINRGGHDQVTDELHMIMLKITFFLILHTISCFFCSKNMHRVDTENLTEDKQVIHFTQISSKTLLLEINRMSCFQNSVRQKVIYQHARLCSGNQLQKHFFSRVQKCQTFR